MSRLDFIPVTDSPHQNRLVASYTTPGQIELSDIVRNDQVLAFSVQPVTEAPPGADSLYIPDYETTDIFRVGVGSPDEPPLAGSLTLLVGATVTSAIPYNASGSALASILNAALTTEGEINCTATLIETGVYEIDGVSNGAIPSGLFDVDSDALLQPECDTIISEQSIGSAGTRYQVFLVIRQSPVAYSEPMTELPDAGISLDLVQAGSSTTNTIQKISFPTSQTYGGTFSISATANAVTASAGIGKPLMNANALALALTTHAQIHYQNVDGTIEDNIKVTKSGTDFFVEFIGDLGNSASNLLTAVTNIDLIAPKGKSGAINYNTIELYRRSLLTDSDSFTLTFSIQRERASGEVRTLILVPQVIKKDIIDVASMVPAPRPSYYTSAESDALFARLDKIAPTYDVLTPGSTVTITCDSGKVVQNSIVELDQDTTLAISGAVNGQTGVLIVDQDGTGGWTLTLPGSSLVVNGGAGAVTLTGTTGSRDILCWAYDGTSYNWTTGLNFT